MESFPRGGGLAETLLLRPPEIKRDGDSGRQVGRSEETGIVLVELGSNAVSRFTLSIGKINLTSDNGGLNSRRIERKWPSPGASFVPKTQ